jgi:hypothetical protein
LQSGRKAGIVTDIATEYPHLSSNHNTRVARAH